jgi:hypothetical protein
MLDLLGAGVAVAAFVVYVALAGWLIDLVRFAAARLPAGSAAALLSDRELFGDGFRAILLMLGVFAASCVLAYLSSARRWDVHGQDWHDIVRKGGVARAAADPSAAVERQLREQRHDQRQAAQLARLTARAQQAHVPIVGRVTSFAQARATASPSGSEHPQAPEPLQPAPLGDWAVRLIAGFNIGILAALMGIGVARLVELALPAGWWWVGLIVGILVFLLVRWGLTRVSPLMFDARLHALVWLLVALLALFASAPVGVLALTGVVLSTFGRKLGRLTQPRSATQFLSSPLLWILLTICVLLGFAYEAMPPVAFPKAVVATASGDHVGGYLTRTGSGTYLVTCVSLADATSANVQLTFVPGHDVQAIRLGGSDYVDSGSRPSLAALALDALGIDGNPPTWFDPALRAQRSTCGGAMPTELAVGHYDPSLGTGVIAGTRPLRDRAVDGEPPIQETTPARIAAMARRYQPTLLVTVADRNWPVSLGAILAERGPNGQPACLVQQRRPKTVCPATPSALSGPGSESSDYLQLPVTLASNRSPNGQFRAFLNGLDITPGTQQDWLENPGLLDPWASAEIYFYYAGPISSSKWPSGARNPEVPSGLIGLEYWFYYPFNYYPLVVNSDLMNGAPIAGDKLNVDLHQGDWEHIDVLLNPKTLEPEWLYLARHSNEGQFIPWDSASLQFDNGHPVVQAAYGGHPTYLPGCGVQPRTIADDFLADWLVCGSGRYAFRAATTPLVDLARTSWACWPGYFGEARTDLEVQAAGEPENEIDSIREQVFVAGPRSPLQQAENTGACKNNPDGAETAAESGPVG